MLRLVFQFLGAWIVMGCSGSEESRLFQPPVDSGPPPPPPMLKVDKIDLLVMVDNSASMGDKQALLALALPELVTGLLARVQDVHVGVVSSSMGGAGALDVCDGNATIGAQEAPTLTMFNRHNDDRAHLINRKKPDAQMPPPNGIEDPVTDALPKNFLAWIPGGISQTQLIGDFSDLVTGAGEFGCGVEAQLESWYRFLVQPDPYDSLALDMSQSPAAVQFIGVDTTILQQRHDFLRPGSAVIVLVVTDEEDSWSDPMWLGGRAWLTRAQNNPYSMSAQIPGSTSICATKPTDPPCQWCAFKGTEADPNCLLPNKGVYGPKEDGLNVRYTDEMKRRYETNPQFPVTRYVDGLSSALVPDRIGEHYTADLKFSSTYLGRKMCRNPLFAGELPTDPNGELCKLKPGLRTSDLVFFAVIGGVPWQLLTENPQSPNTSPFKPSLGDAEWTRILGKDPGSYVIDGIDPHMIESIAPRAGIACGPGSPSNCDPLHGREWDTLTSKVGIDLQYACTFTLPMPKDCTKLPEGATCDCSMAATPPLCEANPNDSGNLTLQARGKAYPTIRELRVAKGVGDRGIVGSICPRTLDTSSTDFGYRPVVRQILERVRGVLK